MFAAQDGVTPSDKLYVDDVFSTYLYTGNGSTQTITSGIDLAGKGGLVWLKNRSMAGESHTLQDSSKSGYLSTNSSGANQPFTYASFLSNGFSLSSNINRINATDQRYVSWTFRKAPKFFDVVTYTGNGVAGRQIPHSLGVEPRIVIMKKTNTADSWYVFSQDVPASIKGSNPWYWYPGLLDSTAAFSGATSRLGGVSSSNITIETLANYSGDTWVAYLFAHDTSTDGIIQCSSYTGNGSANGPVVSLGWEPQYLMIKNASGTGNWQIIDSMRGMTVGSADATLQANMSNAESAVDYVSPTATGFQVTSTSSEVNANTSTYIYIAIRRPNKPPTTGTQVFEPVAYSGDASTDRSLGSLGSVDLSFVKSRSGTVVPPSNCRWFDRLRGNTNMLFPETTAAEVRWGGGTTGAFFNQQQNGVLYKNVGGNDVNESGINKILFNFRRAPGFFDVLCYTGTGVARTVSHNLGVAPAMMIFKCRNRVENWSVYAASQGTTKYGQVNKTDGFLTDTGNIRWNNTSPTSSVFTVGTDFEVNNSTDNYVAYLFATLPGISKVGSYTGNGTSQTINCGFTTGARFILIKRTDDVGDWYVWDSARGILSANDPHLSLNTTAAEVTTDDSVDPDNSGFIVNQVAAANINVNTASYIFLAIA